MQQLNDRRTMNGWALFDWANSAFALVITTAIFPPYFTGVIDDQFTVAGFEFSDSSWFTLTITLSYLIIALLSPLLSGIADAGGRRKSFLRFFTIMGGVSCLLLFFFNGMDTLWLGTIAFALGLIGFAGGLVFYNSFLPVIATPDRFDKLSARGFAMGYIGSVLLLVLNLLMVQQPTWFGLPAEGTLPVRLAFITVGLWWLVFAAIALARLPDDVRIKGTGLREMGRRGWQELNSVWLRVRASSNTLRFLAAFFAYSAGVQTVIFLASTFASKELGFETSELIIVVLILQIVAVGGAFLAASVSKRYGNRASLYFQLMIWFGICLAGYFVQGKTTFYFVAAAVGLVMGGIQSMSRSTYAKLIPTREDVTSYFSFYDVLEKIAIVLGTFIFAGLDLLTGSMRSSLLALSLFFALGMILLLRFRIPKE
ncbi:MFS transporter [Neolewinella lacunae]|uniref:MFS transporter n=1 Tax=Neolewinella lacunae TaxID=1517758 RepID=A0A923TAE1_9BACT|nr:MFS transporter [Neolewinella lacunae]MBC6996073.1 MFS transporter [Neolewinella lacunae]MDN3635136.1 MFS transporter [Neolewinella lacunae]